jgi:methionyl-tRNA formyltransferase
MTRLRLAFLGTPDFAVATLAALLGAGHEVAAIYCRPPRPAGRGQRLRPSPVQVFAEARGLPLQTPESLRPAEIQAAFAGLALDAAVVVAYGLMLPKAMVTAPRLGCLNLHASLLPRWRGAAPIERAILAGDALTGVTIMRLDEGLDTGPILLAEPVAIGTEDTAGLLAQRLALLGARLMVEALDGLAAGTLKPRPQPAEGVTHARKIAEAEARLDWRKAAAVLEREVRAFDPRPGAWFELGHQRIRVLKAAVHGASGGASRGVPGAVREGSLAIACGDGLALDVMEVQRAGGKAMDTAAFLRGAKLAKGLVLA